MRIKGVIFDMDGTVVDVSYDWKKIKQELETEGKPILHYLSRLKEPEKTRKWKILEKYENKATQKAILKEGIKEFLFFLSQKGIKKALVTNNSRQNVDYLMEKFKLQFDCIISRESGLWKPSGAPFKAVLKELKLRREESCVVGDSHFDIQAAKEAGISRVFILYREKDQFITTEAEVFSSVQDLKRKMENLIEDSE
jgi:HAD superfamily hydrolase (TIGR01549 family)